MEIAQNIYNLITGPHSGAALEQHMAAWVAKLRHRNDAYEAWQDCALEASGTAACAALYADYEMACMDVPETHTDVQRLRRSSRLEGPAADLAVQAKNLDVAHLRRLNEDELLALAEVKIAKNFAHNAVPSLRPGLEAAAQLRVVRATKLQHAKAVPNAAQRARRLADADTKDVFDASRIPFYAKPVRGILKLEQPPAQAAKTVRWAF